MTEPVLYRGAVVVTREGVRARVTAIRTHPIHYAELITLANPGRRFTRPVSELERA